MILKYFRRAKPRHGCHNCALYPCLAARLLWALAEEMDEEIWIKIEACNNWEREGPAGQSKEATSESRQL